MIPTLVRLSLVLAVFLGGQVAIPTMVMGAPTRERLRLLELQLRRTDRARRWCVGRLPKQISRTLCAVLLGVVLVLAAASSARAVTTAPAYDATLRSVPAHTTVGLTQRPPAGQGAATLDHQTPLMAYRFAAKTADDVVKLGDDAVIVRGGTTDVPPAGEVFSGAHGHTLEEVGAFVSHGQLRATTVGEIRRSGGTVEVVPELTRGGNLNTNHVNICLGAGSCPFGPLIPNPVPKPGRIQ